MPSIAILFHEHTPVKRFRLYGICNCIPFWEEQGYRVKLVQGIKERTRADLVIPQIDLSIRPDDYQAFLEKENVVLNLNLRDIRKSVISRNLVTENEDYDQAVIVKTERNCSGSPERALIYHMPLLKQIPVRLKRFREITGQILTARSLSSFAYTDKLAAYKIYRSKKDVPKEVFKNKHLVVERLQLETQGDSFINRRYVFLGDKGFAWGRHSKEPVIKANNSEMFDVETIPKNLLGIKKDLGFDHGTFDYVEINGQAVVFDANPTPDLDADYFRKRMAKEVCPGINAWFA